MSKAKKVLGTAIPFLLGAAVTIIFVVEEIGWHWGIGAALAPIGGAVVLLLFRAGVTV